MTFNENYTKLIKAKKRNTSDVCMKSGFCRGTIRNFKRNPGFLIKINNLCEEIGITPNDLLSFGEHSWKES